MENELNARIDVLLAERRPDRYEPGISDEWLDDVATEIADDIPESEARQRHARSLVGNREGTKTRTTNKLLREIYEARQLPLAWLELLNLPLAVGKERVALRSCAAADFKEFAQVERRSASIEFASRHETCEAAEWLADEMTTQGVTFGKDLRNLD